MPNEPDPETTDYEWQPCRIWFPRPGLILDRHGVRTRIIWTGPYLVRKSRSLRKWMYRHA